MAACDQFWRARLRNAFVARLTGQTAAGSRVYAERSIPFQMLRETDKAHFPAVAVYATDAQAARQGTAFAVSATVELELWCTGADEVTATASRDALSDEVYHAILEQDFERFFVEEFTDESLTIREGAIVVAGQRITLTVSFELCIEPKTPLDAFTEANIDIDQDTEDAFVDLTVIAEPEQPPEMP